MKKICAILLVLLCAGTTTFAKGKMKTLTINTTINCDHCRQCESCAARIENAVYKIKGVKRVDVLDKEKQIVVVYNSTKTSEQPIKETIAANGFDADDVKATPEGIAALDGCCKGAE